MKEVIAGCKCGMTVWVVKGAPMPSHESLKNPGVICPESMKYVVLDGRKA